MHPKLPNPPIKEALIDIRVALPQEVEIADLEATHDLVIDRFPVRKILHQSKLGLNINVENPSDAKASADNSTLGVRCESKDGKQVVQFRLNGFTYSRLDSYTEWISMADEAKELWQVFADTVNPIGVTRIAIRFINVVRIPIPFDDFEDYLKVSPRLPDGVPQALNGFFTRVVIPNASIGPWSSFRPPLS